MLCGSGIISPSEGVSVLGSLILSHGVAYVDSLILTAGEESRLRPDLPKVMQLVSQRKSEPDSRAHIPSTN